MMESEQCELRLCREMCHFSILWFACGYVKIIHYQHDYLRSVIVNNELEIYNILSYSSILVFCCITAIYVSSNVFDIRLVSC